MSSACQLNCVDDSTQIRRARQVGAGSLQGADCAPVRSLFRRAGCGRTLASQQRGPSRLARDSDRSTSQAHWPPSRLGGASGRLLFEGRAQGGRLVVGLDQWARKWAFGRPVRRWLARSLSQVLTFSRRFHFLPLATASLAGLFVCSRRRGQQAGGLGQASEQI